MKETPINVMYVEDDPADVELAKIALDHTCVDVKYDIVVADHGPMALELCAKGKPDILILDMQLPRMNGLEILTEIRKNEKLRDVPVLLLSGSNAPSLIEEARKLGISGFFEKPIDFQSFKVLFRTICQDWFKPIAQAKAANEM